MAPCVPTHLYLPSRTPRLTSPEKTSQQDVNPRANGIQGANMTAEDPARCMHPASQRHTVILVWNVIASSYNSHSIVSTPLRFGAKRPHYGPASAFGGWCAHTHSGSALREVRRSYIELDLPLLIDSAFAAGAAMISFGAVLGKTSPAQITWLLLLQVPLYAANAHLATEARTVLCGLLNMLTMHGLYRELKQQAIRPRVAATSMCGFPSCSGADEASKGQWVAHQSMEEGTGRHLAGRLF